MPRPLPCLVCRQYFDAQHSTAAQCSRCEEFGTRYPGLIELISDMISAALAEHDRTREHSLRP
jgi:hypothetical protein